MEIENSTRMRVTQSIHRIRTLEHPSEAIWAHIGSSGPFGEKRWKMGILCSGSKRDAEKDDAQRVSVIGQQTKRAVKIIAMWAAGAI